MTIAETREKCKTFISSIPRDGLIIGVLLLSSSASFGLGYLTGLDAGATSSQIVVEELPIAQNDSEINSRQAVGKYVASKNGTKYYLPSCSGADRISDENKIWFTSVSEAQAAGYEPAANCKFK